MNKLTIELIGTNNVLEENYKVVKNYEGDSGFDLYCHRYQTVQSGTHSNKIKLGIMCEMTNGGEGVGYMLLPRSSTGSKTPLRLSNSVGVIDKTYRGEVMAIVDNLSDDDYVINGGDRLFQLVPFDGKGVNHFELGKVSHTIRGSNGFGSTGM
jgi:dUTP pyrophosphatase